MPIKFRCTCGKVYKVAENHAGKKMACKGCGKKLQIPGVVEAAVSAGDSFEFSNELPDRSPRGAAPPPLVSGKRKRTQPAEDASRASGVPSAGRKTVLIAGLALFGLLGIGGIAFVVLNAGGGGSDPVSAAPQQYAAFASEHGGFRCEHPDGWSVEQGGGTGGLPPWARFKDGTATISIKASASGSAISDIAGASQFPGGVEEVDDDLSPVAQVHDFQKNKIALDYSDYEEKPGENINIPWGEVRISEFTASEGFGSKVQGFRVTLTGVQWQFNMLCTCPPKKWDEYRPIFDRVIQSVGR
ncbi:MAG: hypothetical protein AB7U20_14115 [Planctomycetaceae bacterium]